MGSLIGVLSTVILVSTVCTLIFAVGAYVIARRNRDGVSSMDESGMPGEDLMEEQFPHSGEREVPFGTESALFKRMTPNAGVGEPVTSNADEEYQWK
jgi:hypothetical protein